MILGNPAVTPLDRVPLVSPQELRSRAVAEVSKGGRLAALFGSEAWTQDRPVVIAVLARDSRRELEVIAAPMGDSYPALTPVCPEAHWFERELWEQWGMVPEGHPRLKPIRSAMTDYFQVEGGEIHEVGVGPVHAGVIEPGHFRFQCWGETVYHLEISLGYQHRGVEKLLQGGPDLRCVHIAETLAGDTTVGHATAYCAVVEALAALVGTIEQVPPAYSAVKVGGVRSYTLARKGMEVPLAARRVTVREARLLSIGPDRFRVVLVVSKGFYVRSLPRAAIANSAPLVSHGFGFASMTKTSPFFVSRMSIRP